MKSIYESYYKNYANETVQWLVGDTQAQYKYNLEHHYNQMTELGWVDSDITYKFNSFGFRCEEFTDAPTAMFLGCSHTVGIGLPVESIWAEIVATKLKLKCANLGQGGGSADSSFRLCHGYIDIINPKIVIYLGPPSGRLELFTDGRPKPYGPWGVAVESDDNKTYRTWTMNENNSILNQEKNLLAIKQLCANRNIKLMHISWLDIEQLGDFARDLGHFGRSTHSMFAHKLLNLI